MPAEKNLYRQLRSNLEKYGVHLQRVETPVGQGVPDVNYCHRGTEGWLELKSWSRKTERGQFKIPSIRPAQIAWLRKRREAGGRAYLLCRLNQSIILFDGLDAPALFTGVSWKTAKELAVVWLEPPIDWVQVLNELDK